MYDIQEFIDGMEEAVYGLDMKKAFIAAFKRIMSYGLSGSGGSNINPDNKMSICGGDLDNIKTNTVYGVDADDTLAHRPSSRAGIIFSVSKSANPSSSTTQIFIDRNYQMFIRQFWGEKWEDWRDVSRDEHVSESLTYLKGKEISFGDTNFFKHTKNLYSEDFTERSFGYWQKEGFFDNKNYINFVLPVVPGEKYTFTAFHHVLTFWSGKNVYIGKEGKDGETTYNATVVAPANASYARVNLKSGYDRSDYMIVKGEQLGEYEKATPILRSGVLASHTIGIVWFDSSRRIEYDLQNERLIIPQNGTIYTANDFITFSFDDDVIINVNNATTWLHFDKNAKSFIIGNQIKNSNDLILIGLIGNTKNAESNTFIFGSYPVFTRKKIISCIGDSITAGVGTSKTYHMYLAEELGVICKNYGDGGTGFVKEYSGSDGLVSHGSEGIGTVETRYGNNNILKRISSVDKNSNVIIVFAGTNDYPANIPLADFSKNVEEVIDYVNTNVKTANLLFLTPIRRHTTTSGENPNALGLKLSDYVAKIKDVCYAKGVPCIDLYGNSGLNPSNSVTKSTYMPDGLHINSMGHKRIFDYIKNDVAKAM